MANLNQFICTAADYKITLRFNGIFLPLQTCADFSSNIKLEEEDIFAIGQTDPIGSKTNATTYSGKLSAQAGEILTFMRLNSFANTLQIQGAVIAVVAIANPLLSKIFSGVNITSEDFNIKAKDKQSLVEMSWKAVTQS
jgi:hypothetical protein